MKIKILKDTKVLNVDLALAIGVDNSFERLFNKIGQYSPEENIISSALWIPVKKDDIIPIQSYSRSDNGTIKFKRGIVEKYSMLIDRKDETIYEIDETDIEIIKD